MKRLMMWSSAAAIGLMGLLVPMRAADTISGHLVGARVHRAESGSWAIVDDLDPFFPFPCLVAPCEWGTGFYLGGPEQGWPEAEDGRNTMYDGHAFYTYAANQWQGAQVNNWASWTLEEPLPGTWEIQAYVPRIYDTDREPTRRARYVIARPGGEVVRELDHTRGPGWMSLGTVDYGEEGNLPSVEIRDLTADSHSANGRAKVVLVDAMRWVEPSGGAAPVTVNAYLYGYPDGATFTAGSIVRHCFSVSRPVAIRWTYCNPQGPGCTVIAQWDDDGTGACAETDPLQQVGPRRVRIEALSGGSVIASDETWFNVVSGVTAVPPPATATATPTTAAPPILRANPPELARKDALVAYLEDPGVKVLGIDIPPYMRPYAPQFGYNEDAVRAWLGRFRRDGYSERDLRLLRRAVSAEEAVKSFYDQALNLSDVSAGAAARLVFSFDASRRILNAVERALKSSTIPGAGLAVGPVKELQRKIDDAAIELIDTTIDLTVPDKPGFPLAGALKLGYSALLKLLGATADGLIKERAEEGALHLGVSLGAMNAYVRSTGRSVEVVGDRVAAGQLEGDDAAALQRVGRAISSTELETGTTLELAKQEMKFADIMSGANSIATLVSLTTGVGSNPLSMIAMITAELTKLAERITLGHVAIKPMTMVVKRGQSVVGVAESAFQERVAGFAGVASEDRAALHETAGAVPHGMAGEARVLQAELDAYTAALGRVEAVLNSGNAAALAGSLRDLSLADATMMEALLQERGPAIAAIRETDAANGALAEVGRELADTTMIHHGSRIELQWDLVRVLLDPGSAALSEARAAIGASRSSARAYVDAVTMARDATEGIAIPAYLIIKRGEPPVGSPMPGEIFNLEVILMNVGGASAMDVRAQVSAAEPFRVLSATTVAPGDVPVGGERRLSVRLRSAEIATGFVMVEVTDRSGRVALGRIPVEVGGDADRDEVIFIPSAMH